MTDSPHLGLVPVNDCVLVELQQKHREFSTREGKYDSRTEGVVVSVSSEYPKNEVAMKLNTLIGKTVHFEEFKEGARITRNGKLYSFIKIEDIRGFEDVETN